MHHFSIGARIARIIGTASLVTLVVGGIWSVANAVTVVNTADQLAYAQRTVLVLHDSVPPRRAQVLLDAARLDSAPEMIIPVAGMVTSHFTRSRLHPILQIFRPHRGIDLSAPVGTEIVAPAAGT